jgi:hypothetical protein
MLEAAAATIIQSQWRSFFHRRNFALLLEGKPKSSWLLMNFVGTFQYKHFLQLFHRDHHLPECNSSSPRLQQGSREEA